MAEAELIYKNVSLIKIDYLLAVDTVQRWVELEGPALACRPTHDPLKTYVEVCINFELRLLCAGHSWVVLSYGLRKCQHA